MRCAGARKPDGGVETAIRARARVSAGVCETSALEPVLWGKRGGLGEKLWRTGSRLPSFVRRPPDLRGRNRRTGPGGLGRNPVPHEGTAPGETLWKTTPQGLLSRRRRTTTPGTGTPKTTGDAGRARCYVETGLGGVGQERCLAVLVIRSGGQSLAKPPAGRNGRNAHGAAVRRDAGGSWRGCRWQAWQAW